MTSYLLTFLLFILPLVVLPFGVSFFETPKVILAELVIEALLLIYLAREQLTLNLLKNTHARLIGILLILSFIGLIVNPAGFFGNIFRLQGIFLFWHLLIFSIVSKNIKLPKITSKIALFSILILFASIYFFGVNINNRAFGTIGEPNAFAGAVLFLLPFALFQPSKLVRVLGLILTGFVIFKSGSSSGILGLSLELVFIILIKIFKLSFLRSTIICLSLILLSFSLPFLENRGIFENRAEIWQTATFSGLQSPIFGHGFGNITESLKQSSIKLSAFNFVQYQFVDSSHNLFLDFWVQGGILGLGTLLTILLLSIKNLILNKKTLELTVLIGLLTVMSFNPVSIAALVSFWWLVGY